MGAETKTPCVILFYFLDVEKDFDRLAWAFMKQVLIKWGISSDFSKRVSILYSKQIAMIWLEGHVSQGVEINRGARQGCLTL